MPPLPRRSTTRYLPIVLPITGSGGRDGREGALAALAARGLRAAPVPDARPAGGAAPAAVEVLDALDRRLDLAGPGAPAAGVHLHVERGLHVGLQRLEGRLQLLEQGLGVLLERSPQAAQQLADLALVVRLPAPEREGRLQGLADLLQLLLQRAPRLGCRAAHVALLQPLARRGQDAGARVAGRARPLAVAPGRELELLPGR